MYGQGRVFYGSLSHSTEAWDIRNVQDHDVRGDPVVAGVERGAGAAAREARRGTTGHTGSPVKPKPLDVQLHL
jgi:type 1 glutamine amidotransferase